MSKEKIKKLKIEGFDLSNFLINEVRFENISYAGKVCFTQQVCLKDHIKEFIRLEAELLDYLRNGRISWNVFMRERKKLIGRKLKGGKE